MIVSYKLSFWWHPFTADDPLMSNAKCLQICSDEETNIYILDGVCFQQIFFFVWTVPLRIK